MKKWKMVLGFILVNILVFCGWAYAFTAFKAQDIMKDRSDVFDQQIEWYLIDENEEHSDYQPNGLYNGFAPYIEGEINNEYVAELVAAYIDNSYCSWEGNSSAFYMMAMEGDNIIAEPENKLFFVGNTYNSNDEKGNYFYRVVDFDKFFSKEEIEDISSFFLENMYKLERKVSGIKEMYCFGYMDDMYIYPRYIALGEVYFANERELVLLNTDIPDEEKHEYGLLVYELNKDYEYENKDKLVSLENKWGEEEDFCLYSAYFNKYREDFGSDNYYSEITDELSLLAKSNINKYRNNLDENGVYENKSIFTYEKIVSRQREYDGRVITEYISYVSKPFKDAMDYYQDGYKKIIYWMVAINIIIICISYKIKGRNMKYDEKASDLFYNVTDRLNDSVNKLDKITDEIISTQDKTHRELLDNEIKNLDTYIKEVIEWSKMETGVLDIYPEEVEFGYLVEAVIKDIGKDSKVEIETSLDMDIEAEMDLSRIAKTVRILIRHIVGKTDSSERVYVCAKSMDGRVVFYVTNKKDISNIGRRKGRNSIKELTEFDLLLAMNYLKAHNGKYWYYNENGEATHLFELPFKYEGKKNKKDEKVKGIYGVIAHEMKTPLNVMKLYNEALMSGNMSYDKEQKYDAVIRTQLELIKTQVSELITSKNLKKGLANGQKENINLSELIISIIEKYKVLLEDKQLTVDVEGKESICIYADAIGVKSIISNCVVNAIKYTCVGSTIDISVEKDEKFAIIKIANKVPENLRYNMDDKDRRVINRIERDGLGLIIAKTYLDICKASYGCNHIDDNVEYWFKFRVK